MSDNDMVKVEGIDADVYLRVLPSEEVADIKKKILLPGCKFTPFDFVGICMMLIATVEDRDATIESWEDPPR